MELFRRLALAMVLLMVGSATLVSYINYAKYRSTYIELMASRLHVIGHDLAESLQRSLLLGLSLDEFRNVEAILQRYHERERLIDRIVILDSDRPVVESSTRGLCTTPDRCDQLRLHVEDNTGRERFELRIDYDTAEMNAALSYTRNQIVVMTLLAVLCAMLCALWAMQRLLRRTPLALTPNLSPPIMASSTRRDDMLERLHRRLKHAHQVMRHE